MKKLAATLSLIVAFAATGFSQGTVFFGNDASTLVRFDDGTVVPAAGGEFTVGLYFGASGSSASALELIATATIGPVSGRFSGGTVTLPDIAAGGTAALQVKVWSTAGGDSFEQVFGSGNSAFFVGDSSVWEQATGGPAPNPPTQLIAGFEGIDNVSPVPEPSTVILAVLGGLGLLLFRRRK